MSTALEILTQEFPELAPETVENVYTENDKDYRAAKAALSQLSPRARLTSEGSAEEEAAGGSEGWLSWLGLASSPGSSSKGWHLGLDDVHAGLNKVGAHVALGFRQAANTLGHYIPSELNPFAEDDVYEEDDDEKERRRRDSEATTVMSPHLTKRGQLASSSSIGSPRSGLLSEEEDLSPEEAKKWE